jgi:hypothetical protein
MKTYEVTVRLNEEPEDQAHLLLFEVESTLDLITDLTCWLVELGEVDNFDIKIRLRSLRLVE